MPIGHCETPAGDAHLSRKKEVALRRRIVIILASFILARASAACIEGKSVGVKK